MFQFDAHRQLAATDIESVIEIANNSMQIYPPEWEDRIGVQILSGYISEREMEMEMEKVEGLGCACLALISGVSPNHPKITILLSL